MFISNFSSLLKRTKDFSPLKVALAYPHNDHVLHSLYNAASLGIIDPFIVGSEKITETIAEKHNIDLSKFNKIYLNDEKEYLPEAINLIKDGNCEAIMKGDSSTASIMSLVLKRDNNLRTKNIVSHVYVLELPTYKKLLFIADCAINIAPTVEQRKKILKNTIALANSLGINTPKVAVLSALETVNPKMPTTVEAREIANDLSLQKECIIEGPLAFDNAISYEAATIKHLESAVAGDVDILLVPNIEAGNMLAKSLLYLTRGAKAAGLVLGAKVPVILTSRADSIESKTLSTALASLYFNNINKN